ncbi:hypothetical protein [Bosea sp. (in: a-proteobacteria)]|uniref:hypothetical protein n=1 Tax=Bosea sp. (in: a-proteobacteria) TaxID=1871050 RepID=UPI0040340605
MMMPGRLALRRMRLERESRQERRGKQEAVARCDERKSRRMVEAKAVMKGWRKEKKGERERGRGGGRSGRW